MRQEKQKKRGEERKRKSKVRTAVSLLNPESLLSAHVQTSQANILHLDQKAAKCTASKWLYAALWEVLALDSTTVTRKPLD